jgi:hypothetical protein
MEEDDEGVKFVHSSSTLTFASVTYNNGHILFVVRGAMPRGPMPSSQLVYMENALYRTGEHPTGDISSNVYEPEVPLATPFRRCAFMICVSVFIL